MRFRFGEYEATKTTANAAQAQPFKIILDGGDIIQWQSDKVYKSCVKKIPKISWQPFTAQISLFTKHQKHNVSECEPKYLRSFQTSNGADGVGGSLSAAACVGVSVVGAGADRSSTSAATEGFFAGVKELNAWLNASSKSSKEDGSSVKMTKERNDHKIKGDMGREY